MVGPNTQSSEAPAPEVQSGAETISRLKREVYPPFVTYMVEHHAQGKSNEIFDDMPEPLRSSLLDLRKLQREYYDTSGWRRDGLGNRINKHIGLPTFDGRNADIAYYAKRFTRTTEGKMVFFQPKQFFY